MMIDIKKLHKIEENEYESMYDMYREAFAEYPKLAFAFPDKEKRLHGIEMVLRYYGAYDLKYGCAYSLDEKIDEAVAVVHSDMMGFTDEMIEAADCENEKFREAAAHFSDEEMETWWGFFEELDAKEQELNIPKPYIYLDFVAVRQSLQGQGRGSRIIRAFCDYADQCGLPIMLFTNGKRDVEFYVKNGFRVLGVTRSGTYGFENTYLWYDCK